MRRAIYPGSFDPITNGHIDIIQRATKIFDEVYICVAINQNKSYFFSTEERVRLCEEATKMFPNVKVTFTDGLMLRKAKELGCCASIRGLRVVTDFEFEFQLAAANKYIDKEVEQVFFMSDTEKSFISSSNVKEFFKQGVDISNLVPECVVEALKKKSK